MHSDKKALESAFELARSGKITTVQSLKAEGYSDSQLIGNALAGQLRDLVRSATKAE